MLAHQIETITTDNDASPVNDKKKGDVRLKLGIAMASELCYNDRAKVKRNRARDFYFRTRFLTNSITLLGVKSAYFPFAARAAVWP